MSQLSTESDLTEESSVLATLDSMSSVASASLDGRHPIVVPYANGEKKARRFCFTIWNYAAPEGVNVRFAQYASNTSLRFLVYQYELGEENKGPHIQGYIHYTSSRKFKDVHIDLRTISLGTSWITMANGTEKENLAYCSDAHKRDHELGEHGGPFTFGTPSTDQGKRSDLIKVAEHCKRGLHHVIENCPVEYIKFSRGIEKLCQYHMPPRRHKTHLWWLYGPTGCGKSHYADVESMAYLAKERHQDIGYSEDYMHESGPLSRPHVLLRDDFKWWDGYMGQQVVIIEDFRVPDDKFKQRAHFATLLKLADRYPMYREIKGGVVQFHARLIIITTPRKPEDTYFEIDEDMNQLLRRITKLECFSVPFIDPNLYFACFLYVF